jgi:mono/diheme cytochrome c family protein
MNTRAMLRFILGFVAAFVLFVIAGVVVVKFGLVPATADVPPPSWERLMAHTSLDATIDRDAPQPPYPFPSSDASIVAGAKLYTQHCAMCHGSAAGDPTALAKGLYIRPPQFVKHGVDDDPEGETYWKIEHGIRFTAMPSYKGSLTEEQIWQVTYFMKNLPDHLPPAAQAEWKKPVSE